MGKKEGLVNAAIDIGSNTVLLLVGSTERGKVQVIFEEQHAPRLGKGVDAQNKLDHHSVDKVIEVLKRYKSIIENDFPKVEEIFVTATSAVRDASNREEFVKKVYEQTAFDVQVLSGKEEAGFTYFGAQSMLTGIGNKTCVLDIGGGSTEVALGSKNLLKDRFSYNIGSVRFTERYLKQNPPTENEINECRRAVEDTLKQKIFHFPVTFKLIGVAGTATSLAHIHAGLDSYQPKTINGSVLTLDAISHWVDELKQYTSEELLQRYPKILEGRVDVFLGGLLILESFMKNCGIPSVLVSTGGIRHGTLVMNAK